MNRVKTSSLAGSWYPGRPAELRDLVDRLLEDAAPGQGRAASGLIVPHAGYRYSGPVAAAAYRALAATPCARIVLLAPSHHHFFSGVAVLDADAFETPLGRVPIDPVIRRLIGRRPVRDDARPFDDEHSLEIQLPFVQRVQPEAAVVPMLFGRMSAADHAAVAVLLADLADERTVFVVSSDFTHYGRRFGYEPFPARDAAQVRLRLRELDMGAIAPILAGDAEAFQRYIERTGATVCGQVPITAFLTWVARRHTGTLLDYRTSLEVSGDFEHTVSYAAIEFPR